MDMDAILDAAFKRVFGVAVTAPTEDGQDTTSRVQRRPSEAKAAALRAMAANGATIRDAAKVIGYHEVTVRLIAKKHGFKFRDGRSKRA